MKTMRFIVLAFALGLVYTCFGQTLRETLGRDLLIGTAMNENQITGRDVRAQKLIAGQFNCVVAENCMKPEEVHPQPGVWNFKLADQLIDFAQKNNMTVNGHVLVWHSQTPQWFFYKDKKMTKLKSREEMLELMKDHIFTVVKHFKGKVIGWDVVNEAFEDDGSLRNSLWRKTIGDDFIEKAFEYAHEADPDVELYYNDYSMSKPSKVKGVCDYVRNMQKKGLRIDGIGMQSHNGTDYPDLNDYDKAISTFALLGLKVMFTELDVNMLPNPQGVSGAEISQNFELQAQYNPYKSGLTKKMENLFEERYMAFFKIYKKHKQDISRITLWGLTDGDSWLNDWPINGRTNYPLLFDRNYQPKPVVDKIIKMWNAPEDPKGAIQLRVLNHWDNMDGTIERGYAGRSIFFKNGKVSYDKKRIKEYASANQSFGINGSVLNNVNASPKILLSENIKGIAGIADILRPYGIKVYLSVNFASPKVIGGQETADPLDEGVIKWWKDKIAEIYTLIPDFGGFLVKANSEGQPGPGDYHRTHAEGANMLADALMPYRGIVMWRAFVYAANSPDRASQAVEEFLPLDGQFSDNVIIQIKNGPVDFQPREPVNPLFLALKHTKMMPEFQITQEYTGESIHTCFLAPMWKEFFDATAGVKFDGIAGVANIGDSENFCGSDMAIANWLAFGTMAQYPNASPSDIAKDFLAKYYTSDERFVKPVTELMLETHDAVVNYMMPLGLHHIFAGGHHYGPEPWYAPKGLRADWTPPYYHKADATGLGFDRTATGSNNIAQYPEGTREYYSAVSASNPYLLWFNHVPWKQKLDNGRTMWDNLCLKYDEGVKKAEGFVKTWESIKPYIDKKKYDHMLVRFERQAKDAWWWRDACLLYFQTFSKMPFPKECPAPRHNLADLMNYHLKMDNYTAADMNKLP